MIKKKNLNLKSINILFKKRKKKKKKERKKEKEREREKEEKEEKENEKQTAFIKLISPPFLTKITIISPHPLAAAAWRGDQPSFKIKEEGKEEE